MTYLTNFKGQESQNMLLNIIDIVEGFLPWTCQIERIPIGQNVPNIGLENPKNYPLKEDTLKGVIVDP